MNDCLISFGSNLGDSEQTITEALVHLRQQLSELGNDSADFQTSSFFTTRPIGGPSEQSAFVNGAARFRTAASPQQVLNLLLEIEKDFGRERRTRWDSRTLDLDLLLCNDLVTSELGCQVPHPRMCFRQFVLQPACQIAGTMLHPVCGVSLQTLLDCVLMRQKDILLVTPTARVGQLGSLIETQSWGSGITVLAIEQLCAHLGDGSNYKLIVIDGGHTESRQLLPGGPSWVGVHGGPILLLDDPSTEALQVELSAALEAMKAI